MKRMRKIVAWMLLFVLVLTSVPSFETDAKVISEDGVVINVLDYGADPTGEADSTEAIWNALQAAKEAEADGTQVTLEFPKGEYHIYKDKAQKREYHTSNTNSIQNPIKTIGFLIEDHENLTIDGKGSLFIYRQLSGRKGRRSGILLLQLLQTAQRWSVRDDLPHNRSL